MDYECLAKNAKSNRSYIDIFQLFLVDNFGNIIFGSLPLEGKSLTTNYVLSRSFLMSVVFFCRKECHCMLFLTPDNDFAGKDQACPFCTLSSEYFLVIPYYLHP